MQRMVSEVRDQEKDRNPERRLHAPLVSLDETAPDEEQTRQKQEGTGSVQARVKGG